MSDIEFWREHRIHKTAKPHICQHCGRTIEAGAESNYYASKQDGTFWAFHGHIDCRQAELAWHDLCERYADEFAWLHEIRESEEEDKRWLREKWPVVAGRVLGAASS